MMSRMKLNLLKPVFFLFVLLLAACSSPQPASLSASTPVPPTMVFEPTASFTPEVTSTLPPTATATSMASPTPTTPPTPKIEYVISTELDFSNNRLTTAEHISIPNNTSTPWNEIILVVPANLFQNAFRLTAISHDNGKEIDDYEFRGSQLYIPLKEPLNPGMTIGFLLYYNLDLPPVNSSATVGPNPFGFTTRQINLVDWYPHVPPYREGQGWLVYDPRAYGEFLVYPVANFDVTIKLKNIPQAMTIAASAPDTSEGDTHRYQLEGGRNFVWSVSPLYQVLEEQVDGTTIKGYVFLPDLAAGEQAFRATVEAFELFRELYGPYPHPMLTMVQADFDHGMEYQSLFFLNRGFFASYNGNPGSLLISVAVHETSHQWWYGIVANNQALEPWLDEALATYSEYVYFENYHPEALDTFWWPIRVEAYHPSGWINSNIYNTAGYREYRDAVYLQGALFLHDLRALTGDEDFFTFLNDYASTYANQIVEGNDFFVVLSKYTQADLSELLAKYFTR